MTRPVRVLIVDDSAVVRRLLSDLLARDGAIEVVGTAPDASIAWRKIAALDPDVVTLDVDMPGIDGLTFLSRLMHARPMPVVVVSGVTPADCDVTLQALDLGAVDVIAKPREDVAAWAATAWPDILEKVKHAAGARLRPLPLPAGEPRPPSWHAERLEPATVGVIAIGASTGGTEAIAELLLGLPQDVPGIVIVQHMPKEFTRSFAARLDARSAISVKEAAHGDVVVPGRALVAPGNHHMRVRRAGSGHCVLLDQTAPVNRHRPSVDVLFQSVAESIAANAVGAILTGMGADGARGLLAMRRSGARTIVQDERSSVVFGMPREAIAIGAAEQVVPLARIADTILDLLGPRREARRAIHAVDR
jgi:two-component system chemotaxis response regulator CheB